MVREKPEGNLARVRARASLKPATARVSAGPSTASETPLAKSSTSGGLRQEVVNCFFGAGPCAVGKSSTKASKFAAVAPRQP